MKELYTRIKIQREKVGLTQKYVADNLEIDPGTYSRIESGKTDITISRLVKIADILKITPSELIATDAIPTGKPIKNPKVTLQIEIEDGLKADIISMAFGDKVLEIKNK